MRLTTPVSFTMSISRRSTRDSNLGSITNSILVVYRTPRSSREIGDNNDFPLRRAILSLEDELLKQRLLRIREIEGLGYRGYGSRYEFTRTIPEILAEYSP